MKKLLVPLVAVGVACSSAMVFALDYATCTGLDIVKENASKKQGYSSAQLEKIAEQLAGRELTFEKGKLGSVSKSLGGDGIRMSISFKDPDSKEMFATTFSVSAEVTDAEMAKIAEALDEGVEIKSVTGKVKKGGLFFTLADAKFKTK